MNKKAQLEIGITMMVILVFLVLLIISLIVYFKFSYVSIKETRQEILDEKFSTLVNAITGLPELKCSILGSEKECLDAKKLIAFRFVLSDISNQKTRNEYYEEFGINSLSIEVVYPIVDGKNCPSGAYNDNCNFDLFSLKGDFSDTGMKYTTPVSIYYPDNGKYKIGRLIITADVK